MANSKGSSSFRLPTLICCAWWASLLLLTAPAHSAPIKFSFDGCIPGFVNNATQLCCPPKYDGQIVDFCPQKPRSKPLRTRKALQCLTGHERKAYASKLNKAYSIMRALPDSDPRSLDQQRRLHCSYGSGSLVTQDGSNITLDIHFSWLFFPWHRYFIFFHERILQHLLGDPDFSLHFWNWDNGSTDRKRGRKGCFKAGNLLPPIYDVSTTAQYQNRSIRARTPALPVDLAILPTQRSDVPLRRSDFTLPANLAVMYQSMVAAGNSTRAFMGKQYRLGDLQLVDPRDGAGSLELMPHASIHWWVGEDMGEVQTSAGDPLFYAHHSNIDRLWSVWHDLPGGHRVDYEDSDFLDAEFLFFDEEKVLRRVKVRDSLRMEEFGYGYENANDASWSDYEPTTSAVGPPA